MVSSFQREADMTSISVHDSFGAALDKDMPSLSVALDPNEARRELKRRLPRLSKDGRLRLEAIRVTRYKPGRRCVVEYDVRVERPDMAPEAVTLIGKSRARRFGNESYKLLDNFWNSGFSEASADGLSVPEPIGVVPRFQMWFQRKVPGETATRLLAGTCGTDVAVRVAQAIHKVHRAGVSTERHHGMREELQILRGCLAKVGAVRPDLALRVARLADVCDQLGAALPDPSFCGIHRDFYPAQVIVDNRRLYLIDFDLYCLGDPALDIGNFVGHMIEQALREGGDPAGLAQQEQALQERFLQLSGFISPQSISAYTTLTLARHVYLSTVFSDRRNLTDSLLRLCEERLSSR